MTLPCQDSRNGVKIRFSRYYHGALAQLVEQLTLNQPVTGSSPVRLTIDTRSTVHPPSDLQKGQLIDAKTFLRHGLVGYTPLSSPVDMKNLETIMTAYRVCARAEAKSPGTIRSTVKAVGYFADYLGQPLDVSSVTASDLLGFIVALEMLKREISMALKKAKVLIE